MVANRKTGGINLTLPNFLGVGAQKSGTSSLYRILVQHPEVSLSKIKETHFFFKEEFYAKGIEYYRGFFPNNEGKSAFGEIDPDYMFWDYVPERIRECLGENIKLIFLLRNPVNRAYSQYLMNKRRGFETEPFEKAVLLEEDRKKIGWLHKKRYSYIERGLYSVQIKRFLKIFPEGNLFFIVFETEFLEKREETIKELLRFLGVSPDVDLNLNIKANSAGEPRFKIVNDFVFKKNVLKKIGKFFIKDRILSRRILNKIDKLNRKPVIPEPLNMDFKKEIMERYFYKDILETKRLIGKNLSHWVLSLKE